MDDKLKRLMDLKKHSREISPVEQKAKLDVLGKLSDEMNSAMSNKMKGLKKVTVASNDPKGLEDGLAKAQQMIAGHESHSEASPDESSPDLEEMEEEMHEDLDGDHEAGESPEHKQAVLGGHEDDASETGPDEMSDEDLDSKIKELMAHKAMRNHKVNI